MKGFKSTSTNPYTYTQSGVWKKGQYTFQAVVLSDSGYAFAFQRSDTTWQTIDLSWQVKEGSYSKIKWTFTLEADAVAFRLIANTVTGETIVVQPMLEKGSNGSTPIAHEEDLRGMDGDDHEFIFTRNDTGIAPPTPLSTQEDDYIPIDDSVEPPVIWTDNAQGVTKELPFEFVSMREKKNGVWLDFSPPSLWAKWSEDGLSVNLLVEGYYKSHWEGTTKVVEIVGGVDVGGKEVVKVSAVFRKGEENIAATVSQSRGFQWYVNGVHLTAFDNQPFITLDETYGDGFADYVVLSYLVNSIREEERREIINISEGMDGIGEEFIFKANNSDTVPPVLPQTTDAGYQNDDYHGDWSDDPVAPTESNQFVWVAKRKKVGGIWEAFGTPSIWTKWVKDGEDGQDGEAGAGILSVTDWYAISTSGTTAPSTGWQTTLPSKPANYYLWNYEVITYTDGRTPTQTQKRVIQGKDARSIYDIKNAYAYSASDTVSPTSGWQYSIAALGPKPDGYFLWVREDIAYTDNPSNYIGTIGYVVRDGEDGKDGSSAMIEHIFYLATSASSGVTVYTSGWKQDPSETPLTPTNKYLWSYTSYVYTNGGGYYNTIPAIIGVYGDKGADGHSPYISGVTGTWWTWDDALGQYVNTGYSPVGSDGAIPYPAGYYDNTKWYRREAGYAPYVQYGGTLYLLIKDTPNAGIPTTNTEYWKAFNNWQAVFVDSLVAAFAKIGGAVFTGNTDPSSPIKGRMISEVGVDGTSNFSSYTGDDGAWQPKLMLDFLNGRARFEDGEFSGEVKGVTGSFKRLYAVDDAGNIQGLITFRDGGQIEFDCDIYSQGYNDKKARNHRYYASNIWCRRSFGAAQRNTLVVYGTYGRYYTKGLDNSYYVTKYFTSKVDSNNNTYYIIPLYGGPDYGDASGFAVDLVIFLSSTSYRYLLNGAPGKKVTLINGHDASSPHRIYAMGNEVKLDGGAVREFYNIGDFHSPVLGTSILGRGWIAGEQCDNNW